jgi:hypothetical protein
MSAIDPGTFAAMQLFADDIDVEVDGFGLCPADVEVEDQCDDLLDRWEGMARVMAASTMPIRLGVAAPLADQQHVAVRICDKGA